MSLDLFIGYARNDTLAVLPNASVYPRDVPFWRQYTNGEEKRLSVVLTTDPLVQNIPDPSRSSMPRLKRSDIGSMCLTLVSYCCLTNWAFAEADAKLSPCKPSYSLSSSTTVLNAHFFSQIQDQGRRYTRRLSWGRSKFLGFG